MTRLDENVYAIALAATDVVEAVVRDEDVVFPVSTRMRGECGLEDVFLSLPCVLDRSGVREVIEPTLSERERAALEEWASVLAESHAALE